MSNPYFAFKQFTVRHDRCTLKVTTDACILGAWFASRLESPRHVLDIGAGSGLLMLMLAQKFFASIHGIEIDSDSCKQARENIAATPWKEQLKIFQGDAREFSFPLRYDFIIANPPFYENNLKSALSRDRTARHSEELSLRELLEVTDRWLTDGGSFGILLPARRVQECIELALQKGFYLQEQLLVRQSLRHDFYRAVLHFGRQPALTIGEYKLIIEREPGQYAPGFVELMKDYYLYL